MGSEEKPPPRVYSHIALHHPAGVCGGLLDELQVGQHLTGRAQHAQHVQVGVGQHLLLLLQALPGDLYHLGDVGATGTMWNPHLQHLVTENGPVYDKVPCLLSIQC